MAAVAFGLGVVSGIVLAFEFGTNWSELSRRTGAIQGPLLGYESFTAFALEASFFGVLIFGRSRVRTLVLYDRLPDGGVGNDAFRREYRRNKFPTILLDGLWIGGG